MNTKTKNEQLVSTLSNISEVVEGRSPWADARRRFMKNKAAVASLVILILIALTIIIGPHLLQHTHDATDWNALSLAPTMENGLEFPLAELLRPFVINFPLGTQRFAVTGCKLTNGSITVAQKQGDTQVPISFNFEGIKQTK